MGMMNLESTPGPIYPRIVAYTDASYGEDIFCTMCDERKAVCPDCEAAVCVFCEDDCSSCGVSVF